MILKRNLNGLYFNCLAYEYFKIETEPPTKKNLTTAASVFL